MPDIDVFIVAGQSNAEGRGNSAQSPAVVGDSVEWDGSTITAPLADPVGGASTGSAWPAFANAYETATSTAVCIIDAATGGRGLLEGSSTPAWSGNSLLNAAVDLAESATVALGAAGWSPTIRGVLWHGGESDARNVDLSTIEGDYQDELELLASRFEVALGGPTWFFVFRVGQRDDGADADGFTAVRAAQDAAVLNAERMVMVYDDCVNFPSYGWMGDDLHYTQDGYNDMGTTGGAVAGATVLAGLPEPEPSAPTIVVGGATTTYALVTAAGLVGATVEIVMP
jgi:hypothetical protein